MTVAAIVQARLGSTRLPAKVLLPLPTGRTVIEEVLYRCTRIPGVHVVVAAIPDTEENNIIAGRVEQFQFPHDALGNGSMCVDPGRLGGNLPLRSGLVPMTVVRGPEHDVLARYVKAAEAVSADVIMRITSDCPLIDPDTCGAVLSIFRQNGLDYVSNAWPVREVPHGWDCEVFTRDTLDRAMAGVTAKRAINTEAIEAMIWAEHVTIWMQKTEGVKHAILKDMVDRSHIRWTLDTLADYTAIWNEFKRREEAA